MKSSAAVVQKASVVEQVVFLAVDAAKRKHNLYTEIGGELVEKEFANRSDVVERELTALRDQAVAAGATRLVLLCEPSGGCEQVIMKTARRLGFETEWANGETVAKLRAVESNDTGKTDIKDPRVIHLLAKLGKSLKHRVLETPYALLRQWHGIYLDAEAGAAAAKCTVHSLLEALFPDFSFKTDFLFGPSGRALQDAYGLNPYRIIAAGRRRFEMTMRKRVARIQKRSLERLWGDAELSVRQARRRRTRPGGSGEASRSDL